MYFANTAREGDHGPDALGLASVAVSIIALTSYPEPEFTPWLSLSIVGAVLLVNLVIRGTLRWWRNAKNKADQIFDEELG